MWPPGVRPGQLRAGRESEVGDEGVRIVRLAHSRVPHSGFLVNGLRLRRALARLHAKEPIHLLEGPEMGLALVPGSFPAAKVIRMNGGHHFFSTTLGGRPQRWKAWLERTSFRRADAWCAVSRYVGETTRDLLQLGDVPVEILPNPVDVQKFRPRKEIAEVEGLILFVGTVCEKKGIRQLIQAMPRIVAEVPKARLWVVGRDWMHPRTGRSFTEYLRAQIPGELAAHILFEGPIEHARLPEVIARATVCVYPSHMEAMGIVLAEGMAMGKAVVAGNAGPAPEVIEDGRSGLLCDPHDPTAIALRVIALLGDPSLRAKLGVQARSRAVEEFSTEALVPRNEAFYQVTAAL